MKMYYYNFNFYENDSWEMAFFISSTMLKQHDNLDYIRTFKLQENTLRRENGWHFTYFMKPSDIVIKLKSFSHSDVNRHPFNNIDYIKFMITRGIDILKRDTVKLKNIDFDNPFHSYPVLFKKYYENLLKDII
jgi:hypothetical protein